MQGLMQTWLWVESPLDAMADRSSALGTVAMGSAMPKPSALQALVGPLIAASRSSHSNPSSLLEMVLNAGASSRPLDRGSNGRASPGPVHVSGNSCADNTTPGDGISAPISPYTWIPTSEDSVQPPYASGPLRRLLTSRPHNEQSGALPMLALASLCIMSSSQAGGLSQPLSGTGGSSAAAAAVTAARHAAMDRVNPQSSLTSRLSSLATGSPALSRSLLGMPVYAHTGTPTSRGSGSEVVHAGSNAQGAPGSTLSGASRSPQVSASQFCMPGARPPSRQPLPAATPQSLSSQLMSDSGLLTTAQLVNAVAGDLHGEDGDRQFVRQGSTWEF
jgi:hypothetical protein